MGTLYLPVQVILKLMAYLKNEFSLNAPADVSLFDGAKDLNFSLNLHLHPNVMHASSKGSDESAQLQLRRLFRAFVARQVFHWRLGKMR